MNSLSFNTIQFHPIQRNDDQIWITSSELARALGYAREDSVSRIYDRKSDEFTSDMTLTVKLTVKGFGNGNSEKETRIFLYAVATSSHSLLAHQSPKNSANGYSTYSKKKSCNRKLTLE